MARAGQIIKQVCNGPPGESYCSVCWWSEFELNDAVRFGWCSTVCVSPQHTEQCRGTTQAVGVAAWGHMCAVVCGWNNSGLNLSIWGHAVKQAGEKQLGSWWTELTCAWVPPFSVRGALRQGWKWRECMKKVGTEEFEGGGVRVLAQWKGICRTWGCFLPRKKNERFKLKLACVSPSQGCKKAKQNTFFPEDYS